MKPNSAQWFRMAIASIAQCPTLAGPGPDGSIHDPTLRSLRHPIGLKSHIFPEIAIALEGRGFMHFQGKSLIFKPPSVILLPPGCTHCEATFSPRSAYTAMWLMGDESLSTALISSFQPGRGWRAPLHRTVRCRSALRLFARVREGVKTGSAFSHAVRRDLLELMVRFYAEEERHDHSDKSRQTTPRYEGLLDQIRNYLNLHFTEPITLPQLAAQVHLTPRYLNRLFHQRSGEAIHEFLTRRRMEEALKLCRQKKRLVKEIAAAVGYDDPLYFSRAFRRYFGRSPTEV